MLSLKEKGVMTYIIKYCKRVEEKTKGITKEEFVSNEDIKEIVCFNVLQIGELAKSLSPEFLQKYSKMPWKDIKGMRGWVAHGYGVIDLCSLWQTVIEDIKPLREYCEFILNDDR